jgi:hypothetical protein
MYDSDRQGGSMKYMLLIHGSDAAWDAVSEEDRQAMYQEYFALSKELRDNGRYIDGNELQPGATATTVRVREGKTLLTDGPFAETRERSAGTTSSSAPRWMKRST